MSIFNSLPVLQKCCCCIGLRVGCFIIAIISLLTIAHFVFMNWYKDDDCFKGTMKLFGYVAIVIAMLAFVAAIYFIYGLIRGITEPAEVFLWALLVLMLFNLAVLIYVIVSSTTRKCSTSGPFSLGGWSLFGFIGMFYCMIVVNSYRQTY